MALKVPVYERQVKPMGLPDVRQNIQVGPSNFLGATEAAFAENAGNVTEHLNKAAQTRYQDHLQTTRQTRTLSGLNELQQFQHERVFGKDGALNVMGEAALKQDNGKPLHENVMSDMKDKYSAIMDSLGDDQQRLMFTERAASIMNNTDELLLKHETKQFRDFQKGTTQANAAIEKQNMVLNNNNLELIQEGIDKLYGNGIYQAMQEGQSDEYGRVKGMGFVSDALKDTVSMALQQGNYTTAKAIVDRFGHHFLADDLVNMRTKIGDNFAAARSQDDPQWLLDHTASPLERIKKAIAQHESGNRDFNDDGSPVVSGDGAGSRYRYQTTPTTAADPGFGIAPAGNDSPEEYNRVGEALINKHYEHYQGDIAKTLAAFNAGRGAVDEAIAKGGDDWQQHIPASTRDTYLPKVSGLLKTHTPLDDMTAKERLKWNNVVRGDLVRGQANFAAALENDNKDQFAQTHNTGLTGDVKSMTAFHQAYGDKAAEKYDEYRQRLDYHQQFFSLMNLPVAQARQVIDAHQPKAGEPDFAERQKHYDLMAGAFQQVQQERGKDPMAYAMQQGYGAKPIDLANPDDASQELANRPAIAQTIAEKYNTPFALLTQGEAVKASAQLKAMTPDVKADTLGKLSAAVPGRSAFFSLMDQLAPDSPVIKMSAGMMAFPAQVPVAQTLLKGESILNQDKSDKKQDGKPSSLPLPSDEALTEKVMNQIGNAYIGQGITAAKRWGEMFQAVRAYYAAKAFETGKLTSDKTVVDNDLVKEAIHGVTGGISPYSGNRRAFVPWGMSPDTFEEQAPAQIQKALESVGYDKTDWKNYDMAQLDNGRYQLHIKGRVVPGAIVNFNASMQAGQ